MGQVVPSLLHIGGHLNNLALLVNLSHTISKNEKVKRDSGRV